MIEKFLHRPLKNWTVFNGFGDNVEFYKKLTKGWANPILKGHTGMDALAARWTPCYAAHAGVVEEMETEEARGLGIGILSDEFREFYGIGPARYKTRYWHFISMDVEKGDRVETGDFLGYCDSTGYSTGDHLHFELKPVGFKNGKMYNLAQNNGWYGSVDPAPYMHERFALDTKLTLKYLRERVAQLTDLLSDKLRNK